MKELLDLYDHYLLNFDCVLKYNHLILITDFLLNEDRKSVYSCKN